MYRWPLTLLNFFHDSKNIIIAWSTYNGNFILYWTAMNNTVEYVHYCSIIRLSSNGQYCSFFKIIALYIYSIIHVHDVFTSHQYCNNEIHEEWIQIQLMIRSLEWVVILFSPFRCFIIPFLCSQHAIKFFDFSFSLCISVTNSFKHVQCIFKC